MVETRNYAFWGEVQTTLCALSLLFGMAGWTSANPESHNSAKVSTGTLCRLVVRLIKYERRTLSSKR